MTFNMGASLFNLIQAGTFRRWYKHLNQMKKFYMLHCTQSVWDATRPRWDIETIPDLRGFAAANGLDGKSDNEIRAAMGERVATRKRANDDGHSDALAIEGGMWTKSWMMRSQSSEGVKCARCIS
jgi:hypothetical protein